jgi:hypothetical protein
LVKLKERVDKLRREADRAAGVLETVDAALLERFSCATVDEAQELLAELQAEAKLAQEHFEELLAAFEAEWHDALDL